MKNFLPLKEMSVDVVESGVRPRKGMLPCHLGQNINFDLEALASFSSQKWQPRVYDALVVAAAVEFCDRTLTRSTMNWGGVLMYAFQFMTTKNGQKMPLPEH